MTGSIKLAALFAGAMLILAQGAGTAEAAHRHKEKIFDSQRGNSSYGAEAYKHGKAYGKREKRYYRAHDDDYGKRAYRKRVKRHYRANDDDYGKRAYRKRVKRHYRAYDGDGGKRAYGKHERYRYIDADKGIRLDRGHRERGAFRHDDDGGLSGRRRRVDDVVLRRDDGTRRVRVVNDRFVRRRSTDRIDTSGLSCGTASHVAVIDGRRVRIGRRVCRDGNGEIFAVAGSRQIIEYLSD